MKQTNGVRFHRRLAVQLGFTVALVTSVLFGLTSWLVIKQERETLTRELTKRVIAETHSLAIAAAPPLLRHDPELGLHPLIMQALEKTPDLVELVVMDSHGVVQGHRDILKVGTELTRHAEQEILDMGLTSGERAWFEEDLIVVEQPVRHLDKEVGLLLAHASRASIDATVHAAQKRLLMLGGLGTLAAILAVFLLVNLNLRPLAELQRGVLKLGSGDLSARVQVKSSSELGMFANLVNSMADGLGNAQKEMIQKERLEHELEIAGELQSMLLPRRLRETPGFEIEAHYTPALEVSGDYYDVIPLDENRLALVMADVSGKGVPGLVVMAMLRTTLRSLASSDRSLTEMLMHANNMLRGNMGRGMFVTCLYGILDVTSNSFHYISAGHCPPVQFGPQGVAALPAAGKPLGMFPDPIFKKSLVPRVTKLAPSEGLLLYTDGLVEAMNTHGDQLGFEPVLKILGSKPGASAQSTMRNLLAAVEGHRNGFPASDDLTMIAFRRQEVQSPSSLEVGI